MCYIFNKIVNAELQGRQGLLGQSYSAASFVSRLLGCDIPPEVLVRQREFCVIQAVSGPSLPAPSRSVKIGYRGTSLVAQWLSLPANEGDTGLISDLGKFHMMWNN